MSFNLPNYISTESGADLLRTAERVLVIGCSGGGKTTLSLKLAARFKLEYLSLDRDVRWLPRWTERDRNLQREILTELVKRSTWVMDGSGSSTFDIRLRRADLVIWLRVPRHVALRGVAIRVFKNLGTVRVAMAEGCREKIPDLEFLSYIWNFEKIQAPKFIEKIDMFGSDVPVVVLKSHSEISTLFI